MKHFFIKICFVLFRTVFVGYTNRDFDTKLPRIAFETYLGALGPLLKAEIGDVIKIVLYNKLNTTLSIQPVGLRTGKAYEGHIYNDSITGNVENYNVMLIEDFCFISVSLKVHFIM